MTNASKDQGREAFEAWMAENRPDAELYRRDVEGSTRYGEYCKRAVQDDWILWQAALATSASALARDEASVLDVSDLFADRATVMRVFDFYKRHAIGSLAAPSCLACGKSTQHVGASIKHMELPDVVICKECHAKTSASPAASSAATVSDAAGVALTDELPGATAALRDLLRAKDLPNEQGALARVRGENMQKAWENARAILAASRAATVSDAASVPPIFYNGDTKRDPALREACNRMVSASLAATTAGTQDERTAFEAWALGEFELAALPTRQGLGYRLSGVDDAWAGWQGANKARAASSATEPKP